MSLFNNTGTMRTLAMLEQGLDAATLRRKVIANNIANVDVPHFKRSEVVFEAELKRAVDHEKFVKADPLPMRTTHDAHFEVRRHESFRDVAPRTHMDYLSTMRNDGNNVDMEDEVAKLTRNQLQYSLMVDRFGGTYRLMNSLIRLA
ncbi:MAG: flagellar basal body rod protein FlgB [bacterium]|nr:flagellar basal body rod protein FlgB [bacterium]